MIAQAPWAFAILTAVIIGVVWAVINHLKSNQIGNLESRLSLRDDEIANYKRKLEGATPDEAAERIDRLEREIAALKPREISPAQVTAIIQSLQGKRGIVSIRQDMAYVDGRNIANGLQRAFGRAGWQVTLTMGLGINADLHTGIGICVVDPAQLDPPHQAVRDAFAAAGVEFDFLVDPRFDRTCVELQVTSPINA